MKITPENLRQCFTYSYDAYQESRDEARLAWDLYHNRHYTEEQLSILARRGQPPETFNVIKMFARMLVGYYSTVVNTAVISPRNFRDIDNANILNDVLTSVFELNHFDSEGDAIKLGGLLTGLMCTQETVVDTGAKDSFGRPINQIVLGYVPDSQIVLDPMSTKDDYSDARWLHRFKWLTKEAVVKAFGKKALDSLQSNTNNLSIAEADLDYIIRSASFNGSYYAFENYLVVHTVIEDEDGKNWSIFWSGDTILHKSEITYRQVRWPYRVQRLHSSERCEYYGIFREVLASQHSINQAVLRIQLMVNSDKVLVEEGGVTDIDEFSDAYNRVSSVIPVLSLNKIRVEKMSKEIQDQYIIIDSALERIKKVLGINESFLGNAYASDSGRKVKLQQGASIMSLRYVTTRIETFYRLLGEDVARLAQQFYYANQMIMVTDEIVSQRWVEINKPMMQFSGQFDPNGQPIMEPILLPMTDPDTEEPMEDEDGNIIMAPVSEPDTEFSFLDFQLKVTANSYNDEDEKAQLMLESFLGGATGNMIAQVNPAGFFKIAELNMRSMKTKYSPDIARVLQETSAMLNNNPQASAQASMMASNTSQNSDRMSSALKLPTNTNEGL